LTRERRADREMKKVLELHVAWRSMIQSMNFVLGDERRRAPQSAY
jgi:hypothetical protein